MNKTQKNIYLYTSLYSFLLLNPIWVLYLLSLHYTLFIVTILDVVFYITIVLAGFPMGRVTDSIGRRKALLISSIATGSGIILFGLFTSFVGIALSYVLWGFGVAINNSALESLSYEYSVNHNLKYLEVFGIVNFLAAISVAIASLAGGYLGEYLSLKWAILLTGLIVMTSSLFTVRLSEEKGTVKTVTVTTKIWDHVKDRRVLPLILLRVALLLNFNMLLLFKQPYYKEMGIVTSTIGIIFFADVLLRGLSSISTQRFSFLVKNRFFAMLFFTSLIFFTIYIPGLIENWVSILFLILNSIIFGFYTNILSEEVNVLIPTEIRASVLSVIFLVSALLTAFAEPFLGFSATLLGIKTTLIIFSFVFLSISTSAIFLYASGKYTSKYQSVAGRR